jgi:ABC-type multidrug transport system fused ATPase/permease subunit
VIVTTAIMHSEIRIVTDNSIVLFILGTVVMMMMLLIAGEMDADLACYFATIGSVVIIIILLFDFLMGLRLFAHTLSPVTLHSSLVLQLAACLALPLQRRASLHWIIAPLKIISYYLTPWLLDFGAATALTSILLPSTSASA